MNELTSIPGNKKPVPPYDPERGIAIRSREITRLEKEVRAKERRIADLERQVEALTQERDVARRDLDSAWANELRVMAMQRLGIQALFIDDVFRLVIDRAEAAEAQVAELRAALEDQCVLIDGEYCYCISTFDGVHEGRCDAIRAALSRTPAEALARQMEEAPGCAACGWNDEHSPQCPHYGRFPSPPSRDTERQQAVARVVQAALAIVQSYGPLRVAMEYSNVIGDYPSPVGIMIRGELLLAMQDALAALDSASNGEAI